MSEAIDELGAVDWVVLEFPGSKFNASIAPVINDLTDRGLIRVLDLLVVKKDTVGHFEVLETEDLDDSGLGDLRAYENSMAMVLGEQDLNDIATVIEPGSAARSLYGRTSDRHRSPPQCVPPEASWWPGEPSQARP